MAKTEDVVIKRRGQIGVHSVVPKDRWESQKDVYLRDGWYAASPDEIAEIYEEVKEPTPTPVVPKVKTERKVTLTRTKGKEK